MNKILLKLVMLPSGLWRGMGADTDQLKAILDVRLKMDDRRPPSLGRPNQKKEVKNATWKNMLISVIMGAVYMFPLITVKDAIFGLSIYLGLLMVWLALMLITDFSNILFDTRDKFIIIPRPVNDKTIVLSRLLHVFIYLLRIVLPMSLAGWIVLGIKYGLPSVLVFPFAILLIVFISLFFVNFCYLLLLRFAGPQKFKEIINYFQIAVSVLFFAAVYLIPKAFDPEKGFNITITDHPWIRFFPSYWIAECWHWLDVKSFPIYLPGTEWFAVFAILAPLTCFWVLIKFLAPQFARNLGGLDVAETSEQKIQSAGKVTSGKKQFYHKLANAFNRSDDAKAGFIITWLQTSRSRTFRMRVFPTFAYVPVYFVYLLLSKHESFKDAWIDMPNNPGYIILLYMCAFVMMNALNYLYISEQYKAAWVYYAAPLKTPGGVLSGAFKALWLKYMFPFFAVLSIFTITFWGWATSLDIILALVNVTLFAVCMVRVGARHFPFSTSEQINQSGYRVIRAFLSMFLAFGLGAAHYALVKRDVLGLNIILKLIFLLLSSGFLWLVWNSYANTSWAVIKQADDK